MGFFGLDSVYIPEKKRARLLKYKYSSTDKSLTSKYILNPYWNRLVLLFPTNVAPNLITLSGLILVLINFATLLYFNPTLNCGAKPTHVSEGGTWDPLFEWMWFGSEAVSNDRGKWRKWLGITKIPASSCAPNWLYFTFAAGLFMYQSLDAIDGKQARRTGTSGPLGELFDHGCDALNTTLGVILTASALNLGLSWWTVASLVATNANFYLTTWEEFHTGTLYLSEFSGPVEGILLIVGVFIWTGFAGPQFWDNGLLSLLDLFLLFSAIGLLFNIASASANVLASVPKPHTATSLVRPLSRLSPYIVHTTALITLLFSPPGKTHLVGQTLFIPFALFWGLSFAHHVGLLILSHLTASKFPGIYKHPMLIISVLASVDANAARWGKGWQKDLSPEGMKYLVYAGLATSLLVYGHFVLEVVGDICAFYDINCLTIKRKPPPSPSTPFPSASGKSHKTAAQLALEKGDLDCDSDAPSSGEGEEGKGKKGVSAAKKRK